MSNILVQVSIIFFTGLLFARLVKYVKLPSVTGYLIGGLILGPHVLKLITLESVETLKIFSEIALGFIAFSIGSEFKMSYFKKVGMTPIVIAFMEAFVAVFLVAATLIITGNDISFSIMLGAIAAATAPAATIMVIKQYKAKGSVTETLLSVVAIDDAAALIAFGFALAITKSMSAAENTNLLLSLLSPFKDILMSGVIGCVLGLAFTYLLRFFKDSGNRLCLVGGFILLAIPLANATGASSLLVCMILGAVFCNLSNSSDAVMSMIDNITPPLFMMFFVLSGAELDTSVLGSIGIIGAVYIIVRVVGKWLGAYLGAVIMKADSKVRTYLGPCLIPQAGVAIGLSLIAESAVPGQGATIRAVILCGTMVYELIGPFITKMSLQKAGEIHPGA